MTRILVIFLGLLLVCAPAQADRGRGGAHAGGNGYTAYGSDAADDVVADVQETQHIAGHWYSEPACAIGGAGLCTEFATCLDGTRMRHEWFVDDLGRTLIDRFVCPDGSVVEPPAVTNAMVARAFRRIPLPKSVLVVQPPGGETLVNFATNFYTVAEPFERSVRLVGQRVDLRIRPSGFGWSFGDGAVMSTSGPGAAYPDLQVTHEYAVATRVAPSVDTTYSAEFRVNGGAWEPVVGTVTMEGDPVGLRVRTATPTLVGYH